MNTKKKIKQMKTTKTIIALFVSAFSFTACNNDDDSAQENLKPSMDKIELGLGNNEIGVIGADFHFNAEVMAGDKIENVQIKIVQRSTETYSKAWSHEITWTQYAGAKNATIHKHFDIPAEAAEGKYDFIIIVTDQNGTQLEEKRSISIYAPGNLPAAPTAAIFNVFKNDGFFYRNGAYNVNGDSFKATDKFLSQITLSGVKGDGKMYLLLISKSAKHSPESIDQIDFNKVIVYDVIEHKGITKVGSFSNTEIDENLNITREMPVLAIGSAKDNNFPTPHDISGSRSWVSGDYNFVVVYKNTTYNINWSQSVTIPISL